MRAPASSVIAETLRIQEAAPARSAAARLFGRSPLTADSRSWYLGALGELGSGQPGDRVVGGASDTCWQGRKRYRPSRHWAGGVFTINAKFHEGMKVWVGSKRLLVNGQRTDHLRNATFEANRVAKLLSAAAATRVDVIPIVAIVAARNITVRERPVEVIVLQSTQLARRLQRRAIVLGTDELSRVTRVCLDTSTWGHPMLPPADLPRFAALRESVAAARRRHLSWALLLLLSPPTILGRRDGRSLR